MSGVRVGAASEILRSLEFFTLVLPMWIVAFLGCIVALAMRVILDPFVAASILASAISLCGATKIMLAAMDCGVSEVLSLHPLWWMTAGLGVVVSLGSLAVLVLPSSSMPLTVALCVPATSLGTILLIPLCHLGYDLWRVSGSRSRKEPGKISRRTHVCGNR
jgi:hypothetical protein